MIFTPKRGKFSDKISLFAFPLFISCVDGVLCVCARMVVKHLWHSTLTSPLFQDWLLTQFRLNDIVWWIIGQQSYIEGIAKIVDLTPKNRKPIACVSFFFVGYIFYFVCSYRCADFCYRLQVCRQEENSICRIYWNFGVLYDILALVACKLFIIFVFWVFRNKVSYDINITSYVDGNIMTVP